jgi:hypothetical protein
MEMRKVEMSAVEDAVNEVDTQHIQELDAFQLALVGGGIGEVILG